jgi:hypothetical protein
MIPVDAGVSILEHMSALASLDFTPVLKDEQPNWKKKTSQLIVLSGGGMESVTNDKNEANYGDLPDYVVTRSDISELLPSLNSAKIKKSVLFSKIGTCEDLFLRPNKNFRS